MPLLLLSTNDLFLHDTANSGEGIYIIVEYGGSAAVAVALDIHQAAATSPSAADRSTANDYLCRRGFSAETQYYPLESGAITRYLRILHINPQFNFHYPVERGVNIH